MFPFGHSHQSILHYTSPTWTSISRDHLPMNILENIPPIYFAAPSLSLPTHTLPTTHTTSRMDHSTDEESRIGGDGVKDTHEEKPEKPLPSGSNPPQERHITWLDTLRHYEGVLDRKVGVEARAVQRKRPEDRDPQYTKWHNQAVMSLLWMSSTLNLACFATGFLGTTLGLDLRTSLTIIITATFLGSAVPVGLTQTSPPSPHTQCTY